MSELIVDNPGILAFPTDAGRLGQAHIGLSAGGPADRLAFEMANALLDNPAGATALEITMGGFECRITQATRICVTGAPMSVTVNNTAQPLWQVLELKAGDRIKLDFCDTGLRAYLAIAGGFELTPEFGSTATVVREGIGGLHGGPLKVNDRLPFSGFTQPKAPRYRLADRYQPKYSDELTLRIIPSYQYSYFSAVHKRLFFTSEYRVTDQADRMGYRLSGPPTPSELTEMYSEGIAPGAVQIPGDGQPIVLLCDRQTIGGYPKIGAVLSLDCARLTQCRPDSRIRFEAITVNDAHNLLHLHQVRRQQSIEHFEVVS